jgi:non-ribosomal peptide synthetase component F
MSERFRGALLEFGRKEGSTLYMNSLAAFQSMLHLLNGQKDILIGVPISTREGAVLADMMGYFVNHLVLRASFHGNPTLRDVVRRVREVALGAYIHKDLPLGDALKLRNLSSWLYKIRFNFIPEELPAGPASATHTHLTARPFNTPSAQIRYDLSLYLRDSTRGMDATLVYKQDLFEDATIERMMVLFQRVLEAMVATPDVRLDELREGMPRESPKAAELR